MYRSKATNTARFRCEHPTVSLSDGVFRPEITKLSGCLGVMQLIADVYCRSARKRYDVGVIEPPPIPEPTRPPLRGSPKRHTDLMEALQMSYLRAVAASAGCVFAGKPEIDEGVDVLLSHTADSHQHDRVAYLQVQMKSTSAFAGRDTDHVSASIRGERWNFFCTGNPTIGKIIVVMSVPKEQSHWTFARHKALSIHHCAYWINIVGQPTVAAESTATVSAPKSQIFNDVALCDMMERIGRGGKP
jgi:hypothetical protein